MGIFRVGIARAGVIMGGNFPEGSIHVTSYYAQYIFTRKH